MGDGNSISGIEVDREFSAAVVQRCACEIVELDRLKFARVRASNPTRDGADQGIVRHAVPGLKIIAVHPGYVGKSSIAIAEKHAVVPGFRHAVRPQNAEPTDCLDGIQEHKHVPGCRQFDDRIYTLEVDGIWRRQIAGRVKGAMSSTVVPFELQAVPSLHRRFIQRVLMP